MFPPILNDLVGKTFLFKIGIERENYLYKNPTFKVLKIMTNIGLINEFDAIGSPTVGVFNNINMDFYYIMSICINFVVFLFLYFLQESQSTSGGTFSALSDAPEVRILNDLFALYLICSWCFN